MPHKCTNCGHTFADGSKEMLSGCPDCGGNKFQFRPSGSAPDETGASPSASANTETAGATPDASETADNANSGTDTASSSGAVGRAASTVKGWVGSNTSAQDDPTRSRDEQTARSRSERPNGAQTASSAKSTASAGSSTAPSSASKSPADTGKPSVDAGKPTVNADESAVDADESAADADESAADAGEDRAQASARSEIVPEDELPEKLEHSEDDSELSDENQPSLEELREELNSQFESIKVVEPGQYELNLMELYERDEYIIALKENGRYVIQVPDSWTGSADS